MAGQNGGGPVYLFQKHDADHLMRPGRGAERKLELCLAPQIGRKSVRAADQKKSVRGRLIPPAPEEPGKRRAVDTVATFIERNQHRFLRDLCRNRRRFLANPGSGIPRTAFRNFMNFEATKAELAPRILEAYPIAFGKFPFRALPEAADCNDDETHRSIFRQRGNRFAAECVKSIGAR